MAKTRLSEVLCSSSIAAATCAPSSLFSELVSTLSTSTSMTWAAEVMDEWDSALHAMTQRFTSGCALRA